MLGHENARLDHVQKLLAVGGQLPNHLAAQDPNDDLSEFAEELGVFEDAKTQARLARDGDYEMAMADGWQPLNEVGRDLLGPALGTGRANPGLATERNGELNVASAARETSDPLLPIPSFLGDRIAGDLIFNADEISKTNPPANLVISLNLNDLLAPVQRDRILLWRFRRDP